MKTHSFSTREEWLAARRGKITGSRLKDIVVKRGTGRKIGFYELIAERLGVPADDENPMDRGTRLEAEAVERFVKETGKKVDTSLVIWTRDDNESIAVSPDGFVGKKEAVEAKCLASARHIEAFPTQKVPSDYEMQVIQYFIVNDKLETLYMVFFDPRILVKDYFVIEVKPAESAPETSNDINPDDIPF
jgi:putative phage-type endonuclease